MRAPGTRWKKSVSVKKIGNTFPVGEKSEFFSQSRTPVFYFRGV